MGIFDYLVIVMMALVVIVLGTGVISMIRGGEFNRRNSNRLMRLRILFQALAILFLALAWFFAG